MDLAISELIVIQNGLRNHKQVARMVEFVKAGGKFTFDARLAQHLLADPNRQSLPPPIHIAVMSDDRLVLHDGHHRAVAMFLGGRMHIEESEYEYGHYSYEDYATPHPEKGWFTPFNIGVEVRKPDFSWFKSNAQKIYERNGLPMLLEFIATDYESYLEPRQIWTVEQLAQVYQGKFNNHANRVLRTV